MSLRAKSRRRSAPCQRWHRGLCCGLVGLGPGRSSGSRRPERRRGGRSTRRRLALAAIDRQAAQGPPDPRGRGAATAAIVEPDGAPRRAGCRPRAARRSHSQLQQAAAIAPILTAPRALAVFSQLEVNDDWFAHHGPPAPQTDVTDADGVVYRYFAGKGFEFHPLGNFAALNAAVASKDADRDRAARERPARPRACPRRAAAPAGSTTSTTPAAGAPWLSGFAQAVAAQAFARAAALDTARRAALRAAARAAYRSLPGRLVRATALRPLDQALQLQPRRRPERPAPVGDLARRLREADAATPRPPRSPRA